MYRPGLIVTHIHLVIYFWIRSSLIPTSTQIPQALLPRVAQFNKCSQVRRYRGEPLSQGPWRTMMTITVIMISVIMIVIVMIIMITVITIIMIRCGSWRGLWTDYFCTMEANHLAAETSSHSTWSVSSTISLLAPMVFLEILWPMITIHPSIHPIRHIALNELKRPTNDLNRPSMT